MSRMQARAIEFSIIGLCLISLGFIFQPFSKTVYAVGAGLVVLAGLAFNLVPHCVEGRPLRSLLRVALIVLITLVVIAALAIGSAFLYVLYLKSR